MEKKIVYLSGILPLLLLFVSLSVFFVFFNKNHEKMFYFYEQGSDKTMGELRKIPKYMEKEKTVQVFVEELFLGPKEMNLEVLFPEGTKINHLLLRNKKLFIDINNMILQTDIGKDYNIGKSLNLLRKNIKFNFPGIKEIVITISGEEPDKVTSG